MYDVPAAGKHLRLRGGQVHDLGQREGRGDLDAVGPERSPQGIRGPWGLAGGAQVVVHERGPKRAQLGVGQQEGAGGGIDRDADDLAARRQFRGDASQRRLGGRGPSLRVLLGEDLFVASRMRGEIGPAGSRHATREVDRQRRGPRPCRRPTQLPKGVFRPQYGSPPQILAEGTGRKTGARKGSGMGFFAAAKTSLTRRVTIARQTIVTRSVSERTIVTRNVSEGPRKPEALARELSRSCPAKALFSWFPGAAPRHNGPQRAPLTIPKRYADPCELLIFSFFPSIGAIRSYGEWFAAPAVRLGHGQTGRPRPIRLVLCGRNKD